MVPVGIGPDDLFLCGSLRWGRFSEPGRTRLLSFLRPFSCRDGKAFRHGAGVKAGSYGFGRAVRRSALGSPLPAATCRQGAWSLVEMSRLFAYPRCGPRAHGVPCSQIVSPSDLYVALGPGYRRTSVAHGSTCGGDRATFREGKRATPRWLS